MIAHLSWPTAAFAAALVPVGYVMGVFYFTALRRNVDVLVGKGGIAGALWLTLGRLAVVVVLLGATVQFGAPCLLAAFAGFLLARRAAMRRVEGAA